MVATVARARSLRSSPFGVRHGTVAPLRRDVGIPRTRLDSSSRFALAATAQGVATAANSGRRSPRPCRARRSIRDLLNPTVNDLNICWPKDGKCPKDTRQRLCDVYKNGDSWRDPETGDVLTDDKGNPVSVPACDAGGALDTNILCDKNGKPILK
jgi:hypothetical protein